MRIHHPLRLGMAFAMTAGVGYLLCSVLFWAFPEAAAGFMSALFHGLDFRKLQVGDSVFSFGALSYALVVLVGWAFLLGTIFGWLEDRIDATR